jgi:hypothetical protein
VRKPEHSPPSGEELAMERRKEPGLDLRRVFQLMPFHSPDLKCLLNQITSVTFVSSQTDGKAIKSRVVLIHQQCEI